MVAKCKNCQIYEKLDECDGIMVGHYACPNLSAWLDIRDYLDEYPMPKRYQSARFGDRPENASDERFLEIRNMHGACYKALCNNKNLLLSGDMGNGKTYAAAAMIHEAHQRKTPAVMVDVANMLNRLRALVKTDDGCQWMISDLSTVPILVLDDLGKQRNTDFALEALWDIFNTRYLEDRMTVVTTNLDLDDFNHLGEPWPKIMDRVCDGGYVRSVSGSSFRSAG